MIDPRSLRTVFMGTPEFALPTLEGLLATGLPVIGVYTQPDRPSGRGKQLTPPPVKQLATAHGLPLFQPLRLRLPEVVAELQELAPDLIVVVAYGQILPKSVLDIPKYGCINVHASLLPKYRGAAPINHAIMAGESETGVTTMYMDVGLDTGDMLVKRITSIGPDETAGELHDRLAQLGREALLATLDHLCAGTLVREKQDDALTCYAPLLKKEQGLIDWSRSASELHNQVRGLDPWPGAYTLLAGDPLKLARTSALQELHAAAPGTVLGADVSGLRIACGNGVLKVGELQLPGRKRLPASVFLRGCALPGGTKLGQ